LKHLNLDLRVLSFTLLVSMLTGVLFGLAPALKGARADLNKMLRQSSSDSSVGFGWRNVRGWLVVAEVALTMVLLVGAGLLVRTFNRLLRVPPGFNSENVLSLRIDLPRSNYSTPAQTSNFYEQTLERLKALPGVQSVGAINHSPLAGFGLIAFIEIEGHPKLDRKTDQPIGIGTVSPGYFSTLKIPLISGRALDEHDTKDAAKVALVNEVFARRFFPGASPLGKRISFGCKDGLCRQIVGVVGNIKQEALTEPDSAEVYLPSAQMPLNGMSVFVRANSDPQNLIASVRSAVLSVDKDQPIYNVKTLDQRLGETTRDSRSLMLLFTAFATLALALAVVGIFGVVSYSVNRRTHEIGIRMALGARAPDVLRLVMKSGLLLTIIGVGSGLAAALLLTRFLKSLLFGIEPTDTLTYLTVSGLLIFIALLATYLPARRATKVDPLEALRYE
jgi:predicted permease